MELGEGTYGKVTRKGKYAIKHLFDKAPNGTNAIRELDSLSKLKHPNVIMLRRVGFKKNSVYDPVEMYFDMASCDMLNYIEKDFLMEEMRLFMTQMALAVEYLHSKNICHRDIKTDNFLIFEKEKKISLCDFGESIIMKKCGEVVGSVGKGAAWYIAPELLLGLDYSRKIDVWSLGCTFYELFNKNPPNSRQTCSTYREIMASYAMYPEFYDVEYVGKHSTWKLKTGKKKLKPMSKDQIKSFGDDKYVIFIDLLKLMLTFDPDLRPEISDVLEHPFFSKYRSYIAGYRSTFLDNSILKVEQYAERDTNCIEFLPTLWKMLNPR